MVLYQLCLNHAQGSWLATPVGVTNFKLTFFLETLKILLRLELRCLVCFNFYHLPTLTSAAGRIFFDATTNKSAL